MWNSPIQLKLKPCRSCGLPKYLFSRGRCERCARREDAKPTKVFHILKPEKSMNIWFQEQRPKMTGICMHCGGPSCKEDDLFYKHSIAHILPKRPSMFPSVKMHPFNWIELCFWNNNCHGNYDNGTLDMIDLNCYAAVIERFLIMYPNIAKSERRRIPQQLLQYIEIDI